ncbi:alpha-1,2-mannosidase, putative [Filimonas lacunae]|uniref:Alpha-1,2-mannosidase, putative n=1 Tax=Filimonas lacunae TaxID=477680 RepID=A0A173MK98_9BACT|nr:GH92 family glycosyl hydrolase [Filimonas lacunae]BAV07920.1 alpha-1,2-mannosidase [Filimonas lacunae]SIT06532.1 alpha-1,2-mannosidase, putative [Filimonas lacunae]
MIRLYQKGFLCLAGVLCSAGLWAQRSLADYVQPLSGSGAATTPAALKHGGELAFALFANTIPAVTTPFAMTQWTPQTQTTENKCIPPYYYKDTKFNGIRGSHWLSGSCTQDYGSVTVMPVTGKLKTGAAATEVTFSHEDETTTPYEYRVRLKAYELSVSATSTNRCGLLQFTAEKSDSVYLLITPNSDYGEGFARVNAASGEVWGYNPAHRIYQGWGKPAGFNGSFYMQADRPVVAHGVFTDNTAVAGDSIGGQHKIGVYIGFYLQKGESVQLRVGTSFTGVAGAKVNLASEIKGWSFEQIRNANKAAWEKALSKVTVTTSSEKDKRIFYTALYHSMQQPRLYNDVDGRYPVFAAQYEVTKLTAGNYYDDFSLWDTYRAHLPLFEILQPEMAGNLVKSLMLKGQQGGWLSIFPCWNSYTSEMIGDHCTSAIASAYLKGIKGIDGKEAYRLMRQNAFDLPVTKEEYQEGKGRRALDSYLKYGYIPVEDSVLDAFHKMEQVSRTMEYAYDDYALALVAKKMGNTNDYKALLQRAGYYRNVFDTTQGLVRGRHANGVWVQPFHPDSKEHYITEGTPRQYTFYVPQDVPGLARLMGGRDKLEQALDTLFVNNEYWHGNEPGHQIPFMYNFTGAPWKTQKAVRDILQREYSDGPGGLSGNDDAGQMSAWYIFASLGFYPLNPVSGEFLLCAPVFDAASIKLANGKSFTVKTKKQSATSLYIKQVKLNGKQIATNYITYAQITSGGLLEVYLQDKPDTAWGAAVAAQPAGMANVSK